MPRTMEECHELGHHRRYTVSRCPLCREENAAGLRARGLVPTTNEVQRSPRFQRAVELRREEIRLRREIGALEYPPTRNYTDDEWERLGQLRAAYNVVTNDADFTLAEWALVEAEA